MTQINAIEYQSPISTSLADKYLEDPQLLNSAFGDSYEPLAIQTMIIDDNHVCASGDLSQGEKVYRAQISVELPNFTARALSKLFKRELSATIVLERSADYYIDEPPQETTGTPKTIWRAKSRQLSVNTNL